jgi:hypothetical protein
MKSRNKDSRFGQSATSSRRPVVLSDLICGSMYLEIGKPFNAARQQEETEKRCEGKGKSKGEKRGLAGGEKGSVARRMGRGRDSTV